MILGVIGFGKMGKSIVQGILHSNLLTPNEIMIYDIHEDRHEGLMRQGFTVAKSLEHLFTETQYILWAIKPQTFKKLEAEYHTLANQFTDKVMISIMAGITLERLQNVLGLQHQYVLVMPNTPAMVGYGTTVLAYPPTTKKEVTFFVTKMFESIGVVEIIDASLMNEVIPASGSFPAYVYYFVKSFKDALKKQGIQEEVAIHLLTSTLIGSAKMIEANANLDQLISDVCSPGGSTIEGIHVFDEQHLPAIVKEAVDACIHRAKELGK